MGILRDTLLKYCYESHQYTRLAVRPDEWDRIEEGDNYCYCFYDTTGFIGRIFPLEDIIKHLSCPKKFYTFKYRYNYPPLKNMTAEAKLECVLNFWEHSRFFSPFGDGCDQDWNWKKIEIDGIPFFMTYCYIGT